MLFAMLKENSVILSPLPQFDFQSITLTNNLSPKNCKRIKIVQK